MQIKQLKKLKAITPDKLQDFTANVFQEVGMCPLIVGNLVTEMKDRNGKLVPVTFTLDEDGNPVVLYIPHGLTQLPTGYLIIDQNADAIVYKHIPGGDSDEAIRERRFLEDNANRIIALKASAEVTVKIWFF